MFGATFAISQIQRQYGPNRCEGAPGCFVCHTLVRTTLFFWLLGARRDARRPLFNRPRG